MSLTRTAVAVIATGALVATPLALTLPAQADTERSGALPGGGRYELAVDREDGGFEVSADLDDTTPGSRWKVVLRQDGRRVVNSVLTADGEGDLDVDRFRPDTAGSDRFVLVVKPAAGGPRTTAVVTR
jgi:hypothetical protein